MRAKKQAKLARKTPMGPYDFNKSLPNPAYTGRNAAPLVAPPKKPRWKKALITFVIVLAIGLVGSGGWIGWKFVSNLAKVYGWGNLWGLFHSTKLNGEDQGRVNILLAGNSADDPGHGGANLTDSIMLVSVDTRNHKAFMLSIPRDLYVNIPDNGYAKINEVYPDGESGHFSESGYPTGGMGLLEKVVSDKLQIPIHYYALVDYTALKNAVNAVGGVTVNIQSPDPRGLYDPSPDISNGGGPLVKLGNGQQKLNGVQALGLARSRGDSYYSYGFPRSDFDRTEHQRQILVALKDKASGAGTLSNPVKLGELADSFGNNVQTNLKAGETRRLYTIMKSVPSNKIVSAGFNDADGKNLLTSYTTRLGQSALAPRVGLDDYSEIDAFIQQLTSSGSSSPQ
jgi:polyisoprenyl-teichoic acid--peptidoglycan teichoic acid transferase